MNPTELNRLIQHPYPTMFVTVSGAHLYGFPSVDSDYDLRGVHLLPVENLLGLDPFDETVERSSVIDGKEVDLVTHDAAKFFRLMLRKNGYVLEQLLSPLVVQTSAAHQELKDIAPSCITKFHGHHYLGFSKNQWDLFAKETPPRVKPLLYVYRVLLTGIHLMRTGKVEANLVRLNEEFKLSCLDELVRRKLAAEQGRESGIDMTFHKSEFDRLTRLLEEEMEKSQLPETPSGRDRLNDLLIRLRKQTRNTEPQRHLP